MKESKSLCCSCRNARKAGKEGLVGCILLAHEQAPCLATIYKFIEGCSALYTGWIYPNLEPDSEVGDTYISGRMLNCQLVIEGKVTKCKWYDNRRV